MSEPELLVECASLAGEHSQHAATLLRLNECSPRPSPFFTPEYIETYLTHNERHARNQVDAFVLLARSPENKEVVAALPLKRVWDRSQVVPFRRIEFLVLLVHDLRLGRRLARRLGRYLCLRRRTAGRHLTRCRSRPPALGRRDHAGFRQDIAARRWCSRDGRGR